MVYILWWCDITILTSITKKIRIGYARSTIIYKSFLKKQSDVDVTERDRAILCGKNIIQAVKMYRTLKSASLKGSKAAIDFYRSHHYWPEGIFDDNSQTVPKNHVTSPLESTVAKQQTSQPVHSFDESSNLVVRALRKETSENLFI